MNESNHSQQQSPSLKRGLMMYFVVSLFLFFEMALQVSPSVMASELMQSLNISALGLGIMSGCYFYTYTAMQVPSGMLLDRFNPRLVITASILICALGALLFSYSGQLWLAVIARLLMGMGSAFAFVSVLVVTSDIFDAKYFATLTGVTQMLAALGAMSGQMPISHLVTLFGWRITMLIFSVAGFIIAAAVFMFLRYSRKKPKLQQNKVEQANGSIRAILRKPQTWVIALYACLLWMPMSGFASLWGVPFLIKSYGFSANNAALLCSMMWLGLAALSPILGFVSTAMGSRKIPLYASALLGMVAFALIAFGVSHNAIVLGVLIFISGAACAGQALSFTSVKENNSKAVQATAIAINNMAVVISGAISQPLIGWVIEYFKGSAHDKYSHAIWVVLVAYVLASIIGLFFIKESFAVKQRSH